MLYDDMIWVWQAIIGNYGSFFALLHQPPPPPFRPKNSKTRILKKKRLWIDLPFWAMFCPFNLLTTRKIKILKKWKWCLEISSFYTCTINDNHMIYGSWKMKHNRQNFLSFWAIFPLTPLTTQKIKILKNEKTPGDTIILHKCTKIQDHLLYRSQDMVHVCNCYFPFGATFCPFTLLTAPKI